MIETKVFTPERLPEENEKKEIVEFLFNHLEQFGDPSEHIEKAVDYALKISDSFGGFVITGHLDGTMVGAVVVNRTGMSGYIPENILVYIATHNEYRGKGHGKELMKQTIEAAEGAIALHVEPDNPARYLYEKVGFTNKYLEMRLVN